MPQPVLTRAETCGPRAAAWCQSPLHVEGLSDAELRERAISVEINKAVKLYEFKGNSVELWVGWGGGCDGGGQARGYSNSQDGIGGHTVCTQDKTEESCSHEKACTHTHTGIVSLIWAEGWLFCTSLSSFPLLCIYQLIWGKENSPFVIGIEEATKRATMHQCRQEVVVRHRIERLSLHCSCRTS